jgi:hypothetical protein
MQPIKQFSGLPNGLILICLVLPFITVGCQGQRGGTTITGLQLATGFDIARLGFYGAQNYQHIPPEPFILLAVAFAIAGLVVGYLNFRGNHIFSSILALLGAGLVYGFKAKTDNALVQSGNGIVLVATAEIGFWLCLGLFLLAAIVQGYLAYLFAKDQTRTMLSTTEQQDPGQLPR